MSERTVSAEVSLTPKGTDSKIPIIRLDSVRYRANSPKKVPCKELNG